LFGQFRKLALHFQIPKRLQCRYLTLQQAIEQLLTGFHQIHQFAGNPYRLVGIPSGRDILFQQLAGISHLGRLLFEVLAIEALLVIPAKSEPEAW
jgi:hypothetical protein